MAIFLKLSSFIGFPPLWFGLGASYPESALRVTDVLAQKLTLRVTYVLAHRGNRCAGTWQLIYRKEIKRGSYYISKGRGAT